MWEDMIPPYHNHPSDAQSREWACPVFGCLEHSYGRRPRKCPRHPSRTMVSIEDYRLGDPQHR
jgi:hypothetical protein